MSDDVIITFGANADELMSALEQISSQTGGVSETTKNLSSVTQGQTEAMEGLGAAYVQTANAAQESQQADEAAAQKKQADVTKLIELRKELSKQTDKDSEKLENLKVDNGEVSKLEKMNDDLTRINDHTKSLSDGFKAVGASEGEIEKITDDANKKIQILNEESAKQAAASWQSALRPIGNAFDSTISSMMSHQTNLRQAVATSVRSMLGSYISMGTQALTHWVSMKLGMLTADKVGTTELQAEAAKRAAAEQGSQTTQTAAVEAGNAARSASGTAAVATDASTQDTGILKHAGSAAAAVYDDVSQIPYVGWLLAPPAAAAAFAAVAAFSAEGGWERVPFDGALTELHKDEMVLPAGVANTVRAASSAVGAYGLPSQSAGWANPAQPQVASTAAASSGSGAMTMHYSPNISAIDTRGARDFLDQHGRYMVDVLSRQQRNFAQVKK